jgi:hypothetical protein
VAVAGWQWRSNEPKMSGNGWVLAEFDMSSSSGSGCGSWQWNSGGLNEPKMSEIG